MPPDVRPVSPPSGRGDDVVPFLESHGLFAVSPPIHASDLGLIHTDPFLYYLVRRLGLSKPLERREALVRGSYFHTAFEYILLDKDARRRAYEARMASRIDEMNTVFKTMGILGEKAERLREQERADAMTALGWFEAAITLQYQSSETLRSGLISHLRAPYMRTLGSEVRVTAKLFDTYDTCVIADKLVYNENTNEVWIYDPKTTGGDALERAKVCPHDFATSLYMLTVKARLDDGSLQEMFKIPSSATLGGMKHIVVSKPDIRLSGKDRPYHYVALGARSGVTATIRFTGGKWVVELASLVAGGGAPRTVAFTQEVDAFIFAHTEAGKKPEKVYAGEPNVDLYTKRCHDYYHRKGDYAPPSGEVDSSVFVAVSRTALSYIDGDKEKEVLDILDRLHYYATCPPVPYNFYRSMGGAWKTMGSEVSDYEPFYSHRPAQWPDIMLRNGFTIRHRDEVPANP